VQNSILGRFVRIHSYSEIDDCVVLDNSNIGRRSKIKRAIIGKNVTLPPNTVIGYDLEEDAKHHMVTDSGIVVVDGVRSPTRLGQITVTG